MKIKFTIDVTTREATPRRFTAGQVVDMDEASARHWFNRGAAIPAEDATPLKKSTGKSKGDK